jgi:hypothetical protein
MFGLLALLVLAGCAAPGSDPAAPLSDAFKTRAEQVVDAWRASTAGTAWQTGFVPLEDLTVLVGDPAFTEATKQAFGNGWFRSAIMFPTVVPPKGQIQFPDGSTLPVPVVAAGNAYGELDKGDPPPCPSAGPISSGSAVPFASSGPIRRYPPSTHPTNPENPIDPNGPTGHSVPTGCTALTVTAARLGQVDLRTSRGLAKVPAWIFTVAGLKAEVARVAVAPASIAALPTGGAVAPLPANSGYAGAQGIVKADGTTLTYTVGVGACDYDIRPVFAEFDDVVVVAATRKSSAGACIDLLKLEPVTVTLAKPLGARVVLDAAGGHPLTKTSLGR